jgi:hypothetical protein
MNFAAVYDDHCKEWEIMKAEADWIIGFGLSPSRSWPAHEIE